MIKQLGFWKIRFLQESIVQSLGRNNRSGGIMQNRKKRIQIWVLLMILCALNVWNIQAYASVDSRSYGPSILANGGYLGGARLTLLANQSSSQMLSAVLETKNGSLIVIDGGTKEDADHLSSVIKSKGGHVSAWLLTHPHSDHVGALTELLNRGEDMVIDQVYYGLTGIEWYQEYEPYRADMVAEFAGALGRLPAEKLHGQVKRGDELMVDDVKIRILNSPYLFDYNAINNSSIAYQLIVDGKYLVFLGDMGIEAGTRLLSDYSHEKLECDILQMAHHGQNGVSESFYRTLNPKICLWPTPEWLWNNDNGGGYNSGPWQTLQTRSWMDNMNVATHYCIKDGDQIIE
ncbi:MAG: MBL fold metallo-hydrolase [Hungatella sp.]